MKTNQRGRPAKRPELRKTSTLPIRMDATEKKTFKLAAELAGLPLSAWVRERLRRLAIRELEGAGLEVPILSSARKVND